MCHIYLGKERALYKFEMALTGGRDRVTATRVSVFAHLLGIAVIVLVRKGLAFKSDNKLKILNVINFFFFFFFFF